jgi:P4 family phage/plasmid primase-like protien
MFGWSFPFGSGHNIKNRMKKEALEAYLERDWSIIPIGNDKRPAVASWTAFQTAKADEAQINAWWTANPKANIGVVTGKISGITVVDIDNGKKDGKVTPLDTFPATYTVKTPSGGFHLYYGYDESIKQTANTFPQFPHVDIRNDGGYVVGAHSVTSYLDGGQIKGGKYEVLVEAEIAPFPTALFAISANAEKGKPSKAKDRKLVSDLIKIKEGDGRNVAIASMIGKLLLTTPESQWDTDILPAVIDINNTYSPPLPTTELMNTFRSICAKERKRLTGESEPDNQEEAEIVRAFKQGNTKGTFVLATHIAKKFHIVTIGEADKESYVYRDGYYRRAENEVINPETQRVLGALVTKSAKSETMHKIQDQTWAPRSIFETAPLNLIPVRNGVYDLNTGNLLPHSAEYKFKFQFPLDYDPAATCPKSEAFMRQIFTENQFLTMQEWLGYYFHRNYMFKKAVILVGEGDTGKTTFLKMVTHLLGTENVSSVSLQKMTGDKFSGAHMCERHGNIVDELSAKDIGDTGAFKMATGDGYVTGEYKFGNQFAFVNYSKLTFACNRIPDVKEMDDDAYFNRWMVIRFMSRIERKIPGFVDTLKTPQEISGLFNFAMIGLRRLLANGRFSYALDADDTKLEMLKGGSSIGRFVSEQVYEDYKHQITKEAMYEAYSEWCRAEGENLATMDMFGKKFEGYVNYASQVAMTGSDGKRARGWLNVGVKSLAEQDGRSEEELASLAESLNKQ